MNLLVALLDLVLIGAGIGYWLGRFRPILTVRRWAQGHLTFGYPAGRIRSAVIIALLPDVFVPLIWHRVRYGAFPAPPRRRRSPAPALIRQPRRSQDDA